MNTNTLEVDALIQLDTSELAQVAGGIRFIPSPPPPLPIPYPNL